MERDYYRTLGNFFLFSAYLRGKVPRREMLRTIRELKLVGRQQEPIRMEIE